MVRTEQGYWKRQLGLEEDPDEISERSDDEEEVVITRHKLRPDTGAVRKPIIGPVNRNFKQIINKLSPETKGKVLIARADQDIEVEPQQTLAKVNNHSNNQSVTLTPCLGDPAQQRGQPLCEDCRHPEHRPGFQGLRGQEHPAEDPEQLGQSQEEELRAG